MTSRCTVMSFCVITSAAQQPRETAPSEVNMRVFVTGASGWIGSAAGLELADGGVRASGVRFAPTVHGDGDHGFVARLVAIARERGVSGYIDDGTNRWPAIHRVDAGRLVALAVHHAAAGSVLHAV